jgi:hypothetical protein
VVRRTLSRALQLQRAGRLAGWGARRLILAARSLR